MFISKDSLMTYKLVDVYEAHYQANKMAPTRVLRPLVEHNSCRRAINVRTSYDGRLGSTNRRRLITDVTIFMVKLFNVFFHQYSFA